MTPKEKAKQLVDTYWDELEMGFINSKKCALIAVDEIIKLYTDDDVTLDWKYWQDVKQEIVKL